MRRLLFACLLFVLMLPLASAATIENPTNLSLTHAIPFSVAFLTALILWKWMIPTQLSGLQVGFEIDDGLYEVHSLTKGRGGVKKLLKLPNVGFGIALYMMAMTGVLLLISELIFDPEIYYLPNIIPRRTDIDTRKSIQCITVLWCCFRDFGCIRPINSIPPTTQKSLN